jgi:hypothetical protein
MQMCDVCEGIHILVELAKAGVLRPYSRSLFRKEINPSRGKPNPYIFAGLATRCVGALRRRAPGVKQLEQSARLVSVAKGKIVRWNHRFQHFVTAGFACM